MLEDRVRVDAFQGLRGWRVWSVFKSLRRTDRPEFVSAYRHLWERNCRLLGLMVSGGSWTGSEMCFCVTKTLRSWRIDLVRETSFSPQPHDQPCAVWMRTTGLGGSGEGSLATLSKPATKEPSRSFGNHGPRGYRAPLETELAGRFTPAPRPTFRRWITTKGTPLDAICERRRAWRKRPTH